jgi:hypothetical protein
MTTDTPTLDQVIDLARQLPRTQRAELISQLVFELATDVPPERPPMTPDQARAAWAQLRADLSARPDGATSMAAQLDADRRERDQMLLGQAADEADDVHT